MTNKTADADDKCTSIEKSFSFSLQNVRNYVIS